MRKFTNDDGVDVTIDEENIARVTIDGKLTIYPVVNIDAYIGSLIGGGLWEVSR